MRHLVLIATMVLVGGLLAAAQGIGAGAAETGMASGSGSAMMEETPSQHMAARALDKDQVRELQRILKQKGFDPGAVDGALGPMTQQAIRDFQMSSGLTVNGSPDQPTLKSLAPDAETQEFFGLAPEFGEKQMRQEQAPSQMQHQEPMEKMRETSEGTKKMDRY